MTALRVFASRLWGSLSGQRDTRLDEEIQSHLDLLAETFEAGGMSPAAARAAARREFGGVEATKDSTRDARGFPFLASLGQDARYALRQLRRNPGFAVVAILTLAIGIGGTTAIYGVLDVVAFRPLPYPNHERLVTIQESLPTFGPFPVSVADTEFWQTHSTSFDRIALATVDELNLTGAGEPERVIAGVVQPDFMAMLGAVPQLGRGLLKGDDVSGRDRIVVLNDAFWRRRFNGDPTIVGKTIALNGISHEVVGVLAAEFSSPDIKLLHSLPTREIPPNLWKPLVITPEDRRPIGGYSLSCLALLKPGVTLAAARLELADVQKTLVAGIPAKGDLRTVVTPMQAQMASRTQDSLVLILFAVGSVLIVGCANIASLLVGRIAARHREIAVREAMGAGRLRIVRQLIVENLLLAGLGGMVGLGVAIVTLRLIVAMAPADLPRLDALGIDGRVLLTSAALSIAAGLLLAIAPALRSSGIDLHSALKTRGGTDSRPTARRLRASLVVAEIAVGATVVAIAALLIQNFTQLLDAERGFETEHVLTIDLNLAGPRYETPQARAALIDAVIADVKALPGVEHIAASSQLPLTGTGAMSAVSVEGTTAIMTARPTADVRSVTPGFFDALAIPLRSGRIPDAMDRERTLAVVSETLARQAWPNRDPLGQRFRFGSNPNAVIYTVVGTVGDIRGTSLDQPITPMAYVPFPQRSASVTLLVRTATDPAPLATAIRQAIQRRDAEMPIAAFRSMRDVMNASLATRRFQLQLVSFFAVTTALLAGLGIYGTLAYAVVQRRSEIGVRLALGEGSGQIVRRMVWEALRPALLGLAVALVVVLGADTLLRSLLVNASARDPLALGGAAAAIGLTAMVAAALPAFRASRVDPVAAIRED